MFIPSHNKRLCVTYFGYGVSNGPGVTPATPLPSQSTLVYTHIARSGPSSYSTWIYGTFQIHNKIIDPLGLIAWEHFICLLTNGINGLVSIPWKSDINVIMLKYNYIFIAMHVLLMLSGLSLCGSVQHVQSGRCIIRLRCPGIRVLAVLYWTVWLITSWNTFGISVISNSLIRCCPDLEKTIEFNI